MKKFLFYSLFSVLGFLTSCKTDVPQPILYPTQATYTQNNKKYTATEGIFEPESAKSYMNISEDLSYFNFTLKSSSHTLHFKFIEKKALKVGDIILLEYPTVPTGITQNTPLTSHVVVHDATYQGVPYYYNGQKNYFLSLKELDETSKSYFKVTKNDREVFEGEFEIVYGSPKTDKEAAKVEGIITKGFVSIKKERKQ